VANGLHVPPIVYKLRSLSDLIYSYPVTAVEDWLQPRDRLTVNFPFWWRSVKGFWLRKWL